MKTVAAVITGGASGLGAATVKAFRDAGAQVTILDRDTAGQTLADDVGAGFVQTDVTDEASVSAALDHAKSEMGLINVVVNCAGIATAEKTVGRDGPHRLETFQRTVNINLIGSFNVARLAAVHMAENPSEPKGVIVHTASVAAFDGQKGQVAYAASKAGIAGMQLPMARDLAQMSIRTMAIAPGIFRTPMLEGLGEEVMTGLAADVTYPKRLGDPAEYAALAKFIVECDYLNGETIRIDGALRMK
ncbi:SDR family NAD(P)-dependent oxidoreductase [Sulfitobacter sp. 1151]|uniref:SDR family NAD(P)-dependent oxidoreductase n=2 Tax=Parasulfitobacter algicola TaxID=2614809 RepID=A0ABX2IRE1_9RHOB|nr:SDR family NAD(P)-dependent oxidoreductase [Sulfitobacter algicola]NSX55457.1 SDR family NAD(P)-dependent oxidoreductase [Sulfitobacter algicola]